MSIDAFTRACPDCRGDLTTRGHRPGCPVNTDQHTMAGDDAAYFRANPHKQTRRRALRWNERAQARRDLGLPPDAPIVGTAEVHKHPDMPLFAVRLLIQGAGR